jgi:uncharacterized protein YbbC (DUF1343 family)
VKAGALALAAALPLRAWAGEATQETRVAVGLEEIESDGARRLRGKRVGLLAHAASVTGDGRHAVDVMRGLGVDLRRLFGPEHGLRGHAAAGEGVEDGRDPASGLPVVSLYGARQKPKPRDLAGLDVLVVDLQDAGVRFYTYAATMLLALEAVAEAGLELVVLDRPNPLGGEVMEGPERDPSTAPALVSLAPGPLVHGLTMGEIARLVNEGRRSPARLSVVRMRGWARAMTWADTGRRWVSPSPNLRSAEAALAYPGTCLLEATNVSEGRGTETPFVLVGAPWLRSREVVAAVHVPGFRLEPAEFTPAGAWAAARPKHEGVSCAGVRVRVEDPRRARAYAFGLRLLEAVRRLHPEFAFTRGGAALDTLLGTGRVRAAFERGDPVESILASDEPAIAAFAVARRKALLY